MDIQSDIRLSLRGQDTQFALLCRHVIAIEVDALESPELASSRSLPLLGQDRTSLLASEVLNPVGYRACISDRIRCTVPVPTPWATAIFLMPSLPRLSALRILVSSCLSILGLPSTAP